MKTSEIFYNYKKLEYKVSEMGKYSYKVYSQNNEDGIIKEIFSRVAPSNKFFVEFGGWDGIWLSNTANLRINELWDGILFEGDEQKVNINKNTINIYHEYITSKNVNEIFKKYQIPKNFGLLSIDVDGDDPYILESIDYYQYSPDVIVIEYNPGLPNHIPIRYKEQGTNQTSENINMGYFGANINSFYDISKSIGYEFVTTTNHNIFFIKKDLFNILNIEKLEKDYIINTQSNCEGFEFWKDRIVQNEMDWVIK